MTLRDEFASKAMAALAYRMLVQQRSPLFFLWHRVRCLIGGRFPKPTVLNLHWREDVAEQAYLYADAMLAERAKGRA